MEGIPKTYSKGFGMKCIKCMLILINVLYSIIALLMISGATSLKVIFGEYYFELWDASTVDSLSSLWIAIGCFLFALSIFGIAAAIRESTMITNLYGLFLSLIVILQIAATITGFTLMTQTDGIVRESINSMMYRSQWSYDNPNTMDWVQKTFHCCGNEGPSDWENIGRYTTPIPTTAYWPDAYYDPETIARREFFGNRMPKSCCINYSISYDENSLRCENYYTKGCHRPLHQMFSQSVVIWGSLAFLIGFVQIFGVVSAFIFARSIRRNKTNNDIHKWAIHESLGFEQPPTQI